METISFSGTFSTLLFFVKIPSLCGIKSFVYHRKNMVFSQSQSARKTLTFLMPFQRPKRKYFMKRKSNIYSSRKAIFSWRGHCVSTARARCGHGVGTVWARRHDIFPHEKITFSLEKRLDFCFIKYFLFSRWKDSEKYVIFKTLLC